jgi:hypothetical protein
MCGNSNGLSKSAALKCIRYELPITVTMQSKTSFIFDYSNTGTLGLNPT